MKKTTKLERNRRSLSLQRPNFETPRELDFANEKQLTLQCGHERADWPLVVLKELLDNALDAHEDGMSQPHVTVTIGSDGITVRDRAQGIPPEAVSGILKFDRRLSSRESYVSPCRGAQGNAWKTLLMIPFVLAERTVGKIKIAARGVRHEISVRVNQIAQKPVIDHKLIEDPKVKIGTFATIEWPEEGMHTLDDRKDEILLLVDDFTWLNPHLKLEFSWRGDKRRIEAARTDWEKWLPCYPTSSHWYGMEQFERLAAAYISHPGHGPGMTMGDFLKLFDGFKGSAKRKAVTDQARLARASLEALLDGTDAFDRATLERLLKAMQQHSRPIKPQALGIIGKEHLMRKCIEIGCDLETFEYKKLTGTDAGIPWVAEIAFAALKDESASARIVTGINWSPSIQGSDPFNDLGDGNDLQSLLRSQEINRFSPVVVFAHVVLPRASFSDRGKSRCDLGVRGLKIGEQIKRVTDDWAKQMRAEERHANARSNRRDRLTRKRKVSIKDAAFEVMEQAYIHAAKDGEVMRPVTPRQIYYAARPTILERTGKDELNGQYFSQTLVVKYLRENPETTATWDIVQDGRGHFSEPHTGRTFSMGTLEARNYIDGTWERIPEVRDHHAGFSLDYVTNGPFNRYQAILFFEKECFLPLFTGSNLGERYDVAFMSTKGISVTAARMLIDRLCSRYDIPVLIMRDFDKTGFSIARTLVNSGDRYTFKNEIRSVDLGLRLADVLKHDLPSERVVYNGSPRDNKGDPRPNLRKNGATREEVEFLCHEPEYTDTKWEGQRVEMNAFSASGLLGWGEGKLIENGIRKLIPPDSTLEKVFRSMLATHLTNKQIREIDGAAADQARKAVIPEGMIRQELEKRLKEMPKQTWDAALQPIVVRFGSSTGAET